MVYQSDSIWTRQEWILSIPTGSVTSRVTTADILHSIIAVTCWSRALELHNRHQKIKQRKHATNQHILNCKQLITNNNKSITNAIKAINKNSSVTHIVWCGCNHLFFPEYHSMKNQCRTRGNMAMKPR